MSRSGIVFTAARIAELLAESPDKVLLPTPEQSRVIEQPLGGSVLVIAGAGSGKTETMANRVVWLVANGLVEPSGILGLTFTRKAAGELGERVADRLVRFSERLAVAATAGVLTSQESERAKELAAVMDEGLDLPEVSTYNSFASAIVQEFGAIAGVAAGARLIDGTRAWGIAREVVRKSEERGLAESDNSIAVIVKHLMTLDHAVSDNLTTFADVQREIDNLDKLGELPYNEKKSVGRYAIVDTVLSNMRATGLALRLAEEFARVKREKGLIEFSDQLALAVATLLRSPEAVRVLRARTPVVLLDEVQDTSVGQTALLSRIFRGNSVMAVGDPHQSIYGFRGASASNLQTFHHDFRGEGVPSSNDRTLSLSTSWRNPSEILAAANAVSAPLSTQLERETTGISVRPLTSRAQYLGEPETDGERRLEVCAEETLEAEFASLAAWMRDSRNEHGARAGKAATAAVVFRSRRHMGAVSKALWAVGVPNRIIGIGGLLTTPEVTDLVGVLRCLWFADANSELIRLLAGPRFGVGVADLRGLRQAARWFSMRDHAKQRISAEEVAATPALTDPERSYTLLDTLDEIAAMGRLDHAALSGITDEGRIRLREAGQMLRSLRQEVGGDLPGLLRSVIAALRLDIELDAGEHTGYDGSAAARANLEACIEMIEDFLATDEQGSLASVLDWLERATEDDEAAEHAPEPEPGVVQLITVHGSKGLEWDLVAIPRLVAEEFPASSKEGMGWLRAGQLPDVLRGDAAARPSLDFSLAETQLDVREAISAYQSALQDKHAAEERRLAYVAITRAASKLFLSYSFWGGQKKSRYPAAYLQELAAQGLIPALQLESRYEADPTAGESRTAQWPLDPLGRRREVVMAAANSLRERIDRAAVGDAQSDSRLHPVVELLLAERAAESSEAGVSPRHALGTQPRLTASTFHEFIEHPADAARRKLRPMPMRPYRRTRTGNLFHEWVERRVSTAQGTSVILTGLEDEDSLLEVPQEDLQELITKFEESRWADRKPVAVELEISIPFAGATMVCKLDAVYRSESEGIPRYEIVDWKSGRPPANERERALRFLQLDLYRHAYARWEGIDPAVIDVTLFYVAEGQELRGEGRLSLEELEQLWVTSQSEIGSTAH